MNFIDAVRALSEDKCERIKLNDWEYHISSNGVVSCFSNNREGIRLNSKNILSKGWELVNEVKEFEEVEIAKWFWIDNEGVEHYATEKPFGAYSNLAIKLTGTIKKEIKPKVKRSIKVGLASKFRELSDVPNLPMDAQIIAEWVE